MSDDIYKEPFGSKERVEEQLRIAMKAHYNSELWGENGLIAATMRCVEAVEKLECLYANMDENGFFARKIAAILKPTNQNKIP